MVRLQAMIWYLLGRWLDSRGIAAVADKCYHIAGCNGGKYGALASMRLGRHLQSKESFKEALDAYQNAIVSDPHNAEAWCSLGTAYRQAGQYADARRCFEKTLEIDAAHLLGETGIGELHLLQKQPDLALRLFDRVLERSPRFYEALNQRITALTESGQLAEAEHAAREAIEYFPDRADPHNKLGIILVRTNRARQALPAFNKALEIEPDHLNAQLNLAYLKGDGKALMRLEDFIKKKLTQHGETAFLLEALGWSLLNSYKIAEADTYLKRLIELDPDSDRAWNAYAACGDAQGEPTEAVARFKRAHELLPTKADFFSSMLFGLSYLPDMTAEAIFNNHLEWAQRFEAPFLDRQTKFAPPSDPERQLRIGYVSPDLCSHPVGDLLRGVLQQHDHRQFEIHCFPTAEHSDDTTEALRACSDYWHDVDCAGASIDELAALIQKNRIDILIDLSGHTAKHRLEVFVSKPAPIQVSWVGYFQSTGLRSIDYFITDPYTTPAMSGQLFSEIPVRLPHSRFCFTPPDCSPDVSPAPFEHAGYITFGSFNRIAKLNDAVLDAWARIVAGVPDARIVIKDRVLGDMDTTNRLRHKFKLRGIASERVIFKPASSYEEMLGEYADIDIALDPFPYNGGMTTMDALWMGVPVIALTGNTVIARQTLSLLSNIGHEELIFPDVDAYVTGAIALAHDKPRLARLRSIIRPEMSRSPLCDAVQFTADLEMLYRRMWQAWCRGEKIGPG